MRIFSAESIHFVLWSECTLHLAGLWIGVAISNTCHSNKAGLPLSNEHGSQVKDQGRWQCCHNKHKKFPYRPICDVSLLSGHASYFPFHFLLTCASRMWAGTSMATGTCDMEIPKWLISGIMYFDSDTYFYLTSGNQRWENGKYLWHSVCAM